MIDQSYQELTIFPSLQVREFLQLDIGEKMTAATVKTNAKKQWSQTVLKVRTGAQIAGRARDLMVNNLQVTIRGAILQAKSSQILSIDDWNPHKTRTDRIGSTQMEFEDVIVGRSKLVDHVMHRQKCALECYENTFSLVGDDAVTEIARSAQWWYNSLMLETKAG